MIFRKNKIIVSLLVLQISKITDTDRYPNIKNKLKISIIVFSKSTLNVVVCLQKIFWEPSESSLESCLRVLGILPKEHLHHTTLRLDPHFAPELAKANNNTDNNTIRVALGKYYIYPDNILRLDPASFDYCRL